MAWEKRSGHLYFYRKSRKGGHVLSVYLGAGMLAEICADNDKDKRRNRKAERAADLAARNSEVEIDRELADAELVLAAMTLSALSVAGYHKHKGQWRKKRHVSK